MLGFQTICMITGSTGLFPLSGLVMPFLSFGGTGMVTNLVMAGLLLTVPNLKVNRMKTKSVLYVLFIFLLGFLVCFCYLTYIQIFKGNMACGASCQCRFNHVGIKDIPALYNRFERILSGLSMKILFSRIGVNLGVET